MGRLWLTAYPFMRWGEWRSANTRSRLVLFRIRHDQLHSKVQDGNGFGGGVSFEGGSYGTYAEMSAPV